MSVAEIHSLTDRTSVLGSAPAITVCQLLLGLPVGGAEVLAARMARRLRERYRFVFFCLDRIGELGEALQDEGFPVHLLDRRPGWDGRCVWRMARLLRQERVDLIHAHQYTPFFYALSTRLLGCRTPVLFMEHGRWFPDYPRPKRMFFNRLMLGRRDRVVGVGEAVRQALIQNEGIPAHRVGVIYNGIDLDPFQRQVSPAERQAIRDELGLTAGEFVIVQVARLDHLKDHLTAIRTMERLASRYPHVRLVIVGEGPERSKIEAEIERRGVQGCVRLLGLRQDVSRILRAADAALLTSISEGIPLTLIEAMAAGLPAVSTSVGGVPEVIDDGRTGLLAPAGDDFALAAHLSRLVDDDELRQRLSVAGVQTARERFSEEQMHAGYEALYAEMIAPAYRRAGT